MLEQTLDLERGLFFQLNGSDSIFWDHFFWIYSYKWTWIPFYLCFLFVFCYKKNWREVVIVLLSTALLITLCDQISSGFFKPFFQRYRPTHHPEFKDLVETVLGYRGGRYGFISSHATNAFGFATFTILLMKNRLFTGTMIIFALINGYSRIYLGVHFISDVIVGGLVGIAIGYCIYELYSFCRIKSLRLKKGERKIAVYRTKGAYFLCAAFLFTVIILLSTSNQLVRFLSD